MTTSDKIRRRKPTNAVDDTFSEIRHRLANRTPEEREADRRRIFANALTALPLPPGKTYNDMIEGTWPGDESDEEILKLLEELS